MRLDVRAAAFIGHSMGSIVAMRLAIAHPDMVERLVIIGGPITVVDRAGAKSGQDLRMLPCNVIETVMAKAYGIGDA
ncbi:hypothetical protein A2J03_19145 [Rhodococcus sp. EPR-157]|uniref:alpha/beta fold hydrolase n=1 Tax=Rhodococcus sp. EPR-157 TaxID=1813677 RepID=UPI0007BB45B5|nr:hypothetical protein A2J03_19145 [Rhodococcus sp. EPR-157]